MEIQSFNSLRPSVEDIRSLSKTPYWVALKPPVQIVVLAATILVASRANFVFRMVLAVIAAALLLSIYTFMHQASHRSLSQSHWINELLGHVLALFLGTSFTAYRVCHLYHHKHLREETDPQEVLDRGLSRSQAIFRLLIASVFGGFVFVMIRVPIIGIKLGASPRKVLGALIGSAAFYGLLVGWVLPAHSLAFLASCFAVLAVWGSVIDIVYHQGLPLAGGTDSSRSIGESKFSRWCLNGENWHAEHHAVPSIPGCNLAKLSGQIRPYLEANGVRYETGYFKAFLKALVLCPYFLPPELSGVTNSNSSAKPIGAASG